MKTIILTIAAVSMVSAFSYSQTYTLEGDVLATQTETKMVVFEFKSGSGKWDTLSVNSVQSFYTLELDYNKSYQVWFTDETENTKIIAINEGILNPESKYMQLAVDFTRTGSVQVGRGEKGYTLTFIDTDFMPLNNPFDFYEPESEAYENEDRD